MYRYLEPENPLVGVPVLLLQEGELLAPLVLELGEGAAQLLHLTLDILHLELWYKIIFSIEMPKAVLWIRITLMRIRIRLIILMWIRNFI
jgi:hypothetical protein